MASSEKSKKPKGKIKISFKVPEKIEVETHRKTWTFQKEWRIPMYKASGSFKIGLGPLKRLIRKVKKPENVSAEDKRK